MSYEIYTDSSCNFSLSQAEKLNIHILPLHYITEEGECLDLLNGTDTDFSEFYDKLRQKTKFSTSCISPEVYYDTFKKELEKGNDLIYLSFSSGLSSTFENSVSAVERLKKEFPERTIVTTDTLLASYGLQIILKNVIKMREMGADIATVDVWVKQNRLKVKQWFTVNDLYYLFKGGRLNKISYLAASIAQIKPLINTDANGKLVAAERVIGRKRALHKIADAICNEIDLKKEQTLYIGHSDCLDDAKHIAELLKERLHDIDIEIGFIDPVLGVHCGPNTIACFFIGKK